MVERGVCLIMSVYRKTYVYMVGTPPLVPIIQHTHTHQLPSYMPTRTLCPIHQHSKLIPSTIILYIRSSCEGIVIACHWLCHLCVGGGGLRGCLWVCMGVYCVLVCVDV